MAENSVLRIVFVCKGNLFRSPIAERLFRKEIARQKREGSIITDSYGLHGFLLPNPRGTCLKDYPLEYRISKPMIEKMGISMEDRLAKPLTLDAVKNANLILTMSDDVQELLVAKCPPAHGKAFLLTEVCQQKTQLADVDGRDDPRVYEDTLQGIESCVTRGFGKILELAHRISNQA
jgi:protein-tyrosine phosphatase